MMGDSFIIPKAKKIERVDVFPKHLSKEALQELDLLSSTDYSDMPGLVTPPLMEHEYNNSKEDSYVHPYENNPVSPSTYGTRSQCSQGQQPSLRSCLCDPSYSINKDKDSDAMSRFSDEPSQNKGKIPTQTVKGVEQNKFVYVPPFDKRKWAWNKSAKIGPRTSLVITPMVSDGNIPPPFFGKLVQPT